MIASRLFAVTFTPAFEGFSKWVFPADNAMHAAEICTVVGDEMAEGIKAKFEITSVNPVLGDDGSPLWVRIPSPEPDKFETLPTQPPAHPSPIQVPPQIPTVCHEEEE